NLANLTIASGADDLFIGFQPGSDEHGPFYQSPLKSIKINRPISMTYEYNTNCDQWDEGIFSNEYYDDDVEWTTNLVLGQNVKTILKYMFAGTRVQQLHIPETVDNIGVNVIENNEKLNAIIFYDEKVRPNVEIGAFGTSSTGIEMDWEHLDPSIEAYPPGKYQYYVFVPLRQGRNFNTLYHSEEELQKYTYWDDLQAIMVDDMPGRYDYYQSHEVDDRHHESRYLDVPGYEWYRKRYYNQETITPPVF
ncbi:MAG: leucine-rich repeat protein, partial [Bacteroidales bacterium]|nr:leucine-rich repeat protein [Bacteroidales bacterium]